MFALTDQPIVPTPQECPDAGGFVEFVGRVRRHAGGREVLRLEYEAHPALAVSEGDALLAEATQRFGLNVARVTHRTGLLEIGDVAVWIQVGAAHRREAFAGCEWIIDQLKLRVPIWKRETYADGDSGWVGADASPAPVGLGRDFFRRQVTLPELGEEGQAKLLAASVLIVGVGGLGSACLPSLVGSGIGRVGVVDPDRVEVSNLHRQTLYRHEDVGLSKVERAASFATRLRPGIAVEAHPVRIDEENVDTLVSSFDWVIDGTDSLTTKFLLNAACRRHGKPMVTASLHRFEGHLMTILPDGPCLNCLFPEAPLDGCVGTCAESGVLGVVPAYFGVLQAAEVIKGVTGIGEVHGHRMLTADLRTGTTSLLSRQVREGCPGCRGELATNDLNVTLAQAEGFVLVDIRDADAPPLPIEHVRMSETDLLSHPPEGTVLVCCYRGYRSQQIAQSLRELGVRAHSLIGGAEGFGL